MKSVRKLGFKVKKMFTKTGYLHSLKRKLVKLKKRKNLVTFVTIVFSLLILGGVFLLIKKYPFWAETTPTATINIDVANTKGELKDEMFGVALPATSQSLFQAGYGIALKNAGVKLLRIHAGSYVGNGGFTRAIGPKDGRMDISPRPDEFQQYPPGPDEWGKTAKAAGSELMITMPYSAGVNKTDFKNQFVNLVEYMNVALTPEIELKALSLGWQEDSYSAYDSTAPAGYFAWLRKQVNGGTDPGPYNVKYWEIGNEVYGGWYPERVSSPTYISEAIEYSNAMKAIDANIKVGAVITGDWGVSPWDTPPANWNEIVTKGTIENALNQKNQGKNPAIDFLIPHYYGPDSFNSLGTFRIFNPRNLNYKFADGTSVPSDLSQHYVSNIRSVTLDKGDYIFSLDGYATSAPEGANDVYPKLTLRFIDDGGEGNISAGDPANPNSPVIIGQPGTVKDAGKVIVDNPSKASPLPTFKFTADGTTNTSSVTVSFDKPSQKYRLELGVDNGTWSPQPRQVAAVATANQKLNSSTDFIAQSFISNDKVFDTLNMSFKREAGISDSDLKTIKLLVDLYPDSGSDTPDISQAPLATYLPNGQIIARLPSTDGLGYALDFYNILGSDKTTPVTQGTKYWLVAHLDQNLSSSASILAVGNNIEDYTPPAPDLTTMKVKSGIGGWQDDTLKDLYFYVHHEVERVSFVKNLTVTKVENGNPIETKIIALSDNEWYEGQALSAYMPYEYFKAPDLPDGQIKKLKDYYETANSEIKASGDPSLASLPNYSPEIYSSEFSYGETGGNFGSTPINKLYFPALFDANSFISFIYGGINGAMMWSAGSDTGVFRYADPWALFGVNGEQAGSPEKDNPDLYLYNPRYYLLKLLSQNRGKDLVNTGIDSPQYNYDINFAWRMLAKQSNGQYPNWLPHPNLIIPPAYTRPYLNGYTSYDSNLKKLYLTISNSSLDKNIVSQINTANFAPASSAKVNTLNTNDDKGVLSMNGFTTSLESAGNDWVTVGDVSQFQIRDLISLQSTSQGQSQFYKIRSINLLTKTLVLNNLSGQDATIPCVDLVNKKVFCGLYSTVFSQIDVVRVTGSVGITTSQISNASQSFTYSFPAHSVTVIEMDQGAGRATLPLNSPVALKISPKVSPSPTLTPSASAVEPTPEPTSEEIVPITSEIITPNPIAAVPKVTATPTPTPAPALSPSNISPSPSSPSEQISQEPTPAPTNTESKFKSLVEGKSGKIAFVVLALLIIIPLTVFLIKRKIKGKDAVSGRDEVNIK